MAKKWGILIKKESESLIFTGLEIPRDYAIKQEVLTMGYHTRETNTVPCGYHELNPEMEALLAEYLEDGKRKGLQESSIHLHDKIGHYFLSALADTGCAAPQAMNAQNGQR